MSWLDFTRHFEDIYVCRVFKTVAEGGQWYRYSATGEWRGATAGGCSNFPTANKNPQYYLSVTRPTAVFMSLTQEERGGRKGTKEGVGISVHDKGGGRVAAFTARDQVLSSGYAVSAEVTLEGTLSPSATGAPYAVFVSTFQPKRELGYTLTIYTDVPLAAAWLNGPEGLRLIPADAPGK
jgi:hypothetical protein